MPLPSSIRVLHQCIHTFSKVSELQANSSKSDVCTIGVSSTVKAYIGDLTGFGIGTPPFNYYMGVPLSFRRIFIADCEQLVDKMKDKIKGWLAKILGVTKFRYPFSFYRHSFK